MRETYDRAAGDYARHFLDELRDKPLDRALLEHFAAGVGGEGVVVDVGTGPGHVARFLRDRGVRAEGLDLSEGMVSEARARHPGVLFRVGSMLALDDQDDSWSGATYFYAIVHLAPEELCQALRELRRVLRPGAPALLAFHVGEEVVTVTEFLGHAVSLDWRFFPLETVVALAREAGLAVELELRRKAYPTEHPSVRGYVLVRKATG